MTYRIKPLAWKLDGTAYSAKTKIGEYRVANIHGEWMWFFTWFPDSQTDRISKGRVTPNTVESAKAAAFDDLVRRVRSLIKPEPTDPLADAMKLPEIRALVDYSRKVLVACDDANKPWDLPARIVRGLDDALAALTKEGE